MAKVIICQVWNYNKIMEQEEMKTTIEWLKEQVQILVEKVKTLSEQGEQKNAEPHEDKKETDGSDNVASLLAPVVNQLNDLKELVKGLEAKIVEAEKRNLDVFVSEQNSKMSQFDATIRQLKETISGEHMQLLDRMHDYQMQLGIMQNELDDKQEKLQTITQNVQEDRYRKDKIKLINRCIMQLDIIRKTLFDFNHGAEAIENKEAFLYRQLQEIVTGMEATLSYEGVETKNFTAIGEKVDTQNQEVVEVVATDDKQKDGTVASSINPGYVWTLPYIIKGRKTDNNEEILNYRFLLQSEQVAAYKYVEPQPAEPQSEQEEQSASTTGQPQDEQPKNQSDEVVQEAVQSESVNQ